MYYSLHSNLVLFKFVKRKLALWCCLLYIPIWFYSNCLTSAVPPITIFFTFQSGSIQITIESRRAFRQAYFTFQSGSIQIRTAFEFQKGFGVFTFQSGSIQIFLSLHSNLVLFKWGKGKNTIFDAINFTFQSGSIQIAKQITIC